MSKTAFYYCYWIDCYGDKQRQEIRELTKKYKARERSCSDIAIVVEIPHARSEDFKADLNTKKYIYDNFGLMPRV
jgi:hypothetical protein